MSWDLPGTELNYGDKPGCPWLGPCPALACPCLVPCLPKTPSVPRHPGCSPAGPERLCPSPPWWPTLRSAELRWQAALSPQRSCPGAALSPGRVWGELCARPLQEPSRQFHCWSSDLTSRPRHFGEELFPSSLLQKPRAAARAGLWGSGSSTKPH